MNVTIRTLCIFFGLLLIFIHIVVVIRFDLQKKSLYILRRDFSTQCFQWESKYSAMFKEYACLNSSEINSIVWTYDGSGLMKYIQWIVIRKLSNVRITTLNDDCGIIKNSNFFPISKDNMFIQIYILSLSANFSTSSNCFRKIVEIGNTDDKNKKQFFFKRKSLNATIFYQQLDSVTSAKEFTFQVNNTVKENTEELLNNANWTPIYSEDLIKSDLSDTEASLKHFVSFLSPKLPKEILHKVIEYDSHKFTKDATWWDQSQVADSIISKLIPKHPVKLTYENDFYRLHGKQPFAQYLLQNRQCYKHGIFTQTQSEIVKDHSSTDTPNRCSTRPFDCAFGDIYSFKDREKIYNEIDTERSFNENSIKCGFAIPTIFDKVRNIYGRNSTCETIVYTSITNCYDPLPTIKGKILPSFCFVALLDSKTIEGYKKTYKNKLNVTWDFIDMGTDVVPWSSEAKTSETLRIVGHQIFPLAKWIIWIDGKGRVTDIEELLIQAQTPFIGSQHGDLKRTSASEVMPTIQRIRSREKPLSLRLNNSIFDIELQEKEYRREGFYKRSDYLGLKMYDIAITIRRNNHPCFVRYLCAWHNEVNYYSYRGQLSVFYPGVRLNLTDYMHFLPRQFFSAASHRKGC